MKKSITKGQVFDSSHVSENSRILKNIKERQYVSNFLVLVEGVERKEECC